MKRATPMGQRSDAWIFPKPESPALSFDRMNSEPSDVPWDPPPLRGRAPGPTPEGVLLAAIKRELKHGVPGALRATGHLEAFQRLGPQRV